jgi:uncharacterized membrane protein YccF (DUF307 family)
VSKNPQIIVNSSKGPGCLIQLLWFLFIGWWLGQLWVLVAWVFILTILGIPLGVMMLNNIPQIFALRGKSSHTTMTTVGGVTSIRVGVSAPQHNFVVRAIYFILIGWWLSLIWMEIAYLFCLTLIGIPLGFWMFDCTPAVVSLRRS